MTKGGLIVVGHRGAAARAPENTAPSFSLALAAGVNAVEFDVQLTADDRALVHHDATTRRVCGHNGSIREMTLAECCELSVRPDFRKNQTWRRTRMLSLDEALAILRPDVDVHVELKGPPSHAEPLVREVLLALRRTGGFNRALLTSAEPAMVQEAARNAPDLQLGIVYPSRPSFSLNRLATEIQASFVVPNRSHVTKSWVKNQHRQGRKILPYTVNTRQELTRLHRVGVDGVITDDPGRMIRWVELVGDQRRSSPPRPSRARAPVLSIDLGSTEVKIALVSHQGVPLKLVRKPLPTLRGPKGELGLDAETVERLVTREASRLLLEEENVRTVALASQRSTFVLWDRETGKPIGDAPSWRCTRGRRLVAARKDSAHLVRDRTGLLLSPSYSASKIAWKLRRTRVHSDRLLCGPLPTYLLWRWSEGRIFRTDPTLAARMLLMNLRRRDWDPELLSLFGIPASILPEIADTCGSPAEIMLGGRKLVTRCQIGDQQAALAAFGSGEVQTGPACLNLGTGGFLLANTGSVLHRVPGLLSSIAWSQGGKAEYLIEGTVHRVVPSIQGFLAQNDADQLSLGELAARGEAGTYVLPAQEGLGSPFWDPRRRFVVRGRRNAPGLARGLLESIAYLVRENLIRLGRVVPDRSRLTVGGGLSRNPHLLQILADTLCASLLVSPVQESTIIGAALLALGGQARLREREPLTVIHPRTRPRQAERLHREWRRKVLD